MKNYPNILIIGGTARNVGKTEFVCNCIKHFSKSANIIALKITNHFHDLTAKPYNIAEEFNRDSHKDSSRMLRAGASRVFYIQTDSNHLQLSFEEFLNRIPVNSVLICESNALRDIINPGLYLIIKSSSETEIKESARKLSKYADRIVVSNGDSFNLKVADISLRNNSWTLV